MNARRLALLALLASVALAPTPHAEPARRLPPPAPVATAAPAPAAAPAFNKTLTDTVLRQAFAALHERYLDPQPLPELAWRALSGLSGLSPSVVATRAGAEWRLAVEGRPVAVWRAPAAGDAPGWAGLVAGFAASAQAAPAVRQAGQPGTLAAMLNAVTAPLDSYTRYVPPPEARAAQGRRRGEGGIGVRAVPAGDGAAIAEVIPESPADHAGLAEGDRILAVDGQRLRGLSEEAIAALLGGEEDTRLVLSIRPLRGGGTRQVALIRALVVPPSVAAERRGEVMVLRITTFNRLTDQHLARSLLEMQASPRPPAGIVLDLRGNRGGLLRQAVAVVDLFVARGEIVATRGRHPDAARTYVAAGADLAGEAPLAVLVDAGTASAAEIVAAGLQARGRGAVVGSGTMGKGLVQTVVRLADEGELVLTWSRVLVPPGQPLHEVGVLPVLCTALGPEEIFRQLAALRAGTEPGRARPCPARDGTPADMEAAIALLAEPAALAAAIGQPRAARATPPRAGEPLAGAN